MLTKTCPKCKKQSEGNEQFCSKCGTILNSIPDCDSLETKEKPADYTWRRGIARLVDVFLK